MTLEEEVRELAKFAKAASAKLAQATTEERNGALYAMAAALRAQAPAIVEANGEDMEAARAAGTTEALLDRLMLDESRVFAMADALEEVAALPDPLGVVSLESTLYNGIELRRVSVPLGVVAMVYEARPNVTADAAGVCVKSGNACILRGGSLAARSNEVIADVLAAAAVEAGLPEGSICAVTTTDRAATDVLMGLHGLVDVLIPRGGAGLIRHCVEHAKVPVIETGTGNCHVYVHASADPEMARAIIRNAKCRRFGVCNAAETLLVDAAVADAVLPSILADMKEAGVLVHGDARVLAIADKLNFSLSRSAAALKSGRSLRIAVLMSGHIRLWFTASVIEGLNEVLHTQGYDISVFQISSIEERKEFFEMLPVRRNADAVIVASFDIDNNEIAQLASVGVPIVGINSVEPEARGFTAAVNIDDVQGSTLAARHLINLGHRRITYISTNREVSLSFSVQSRFDSFTACCRREGIEPQVIVCKVDDDGRYEISDVVNQLISQDEMPTAIACQEDGIALPLMFQLERNGFSVPGDVSLIGYDDSFYTGDIGLTTIRQDPVEMARVAARMTLDLIDEKPIEQPYIVFPAQLKVRSSTSRVK